MPGPWHERRYRFVQQLLEVVDIENETRGVGDVSSRRSIRTQVLGLAWPVVVEQLLGTAVGLVNTYIVAHLGTAALAAVGLSSQLAALLMALFSAVGVGSTALVARHTGAREPGEAAHIAGQSLLLAVAVGAAAALPCLLGGRALLTALGGAADVVTLGRPFLIALGTTMPLMAVLFIGNAALRGAGDTRTPMAVMALVNVSNAAVSASLVYGLGPLPALGVLGAGIGWAVSEALGGLIVTVALLRGRSDAGLRVTPATLRFQPTRTWRLLRIGLPAGAEQVLMRLAQLALAAVVTGLGTASYAGHQLGIQLLSVAFMPGFALSVAATTLVGQELGRGAPARAEACGRVACQIALAVMCSMGAALYLLAEPLLRFFTSDPAVVAEGLKAVRGCALLQPSLAWYYVLSGALRGAGDTRFVLLTQAGAIWLVRLSLAYRLGLTFGLGLTGVWAAMILDISSRAAMLALRFRSGAWKKLRV
jgi:MATE family multidrug resistance protein